MKRRAISGARRGQAAVVFLHRRRLVALAVLVGSVAAALSCAAGVVSVEVVHLTLASAAGAVEPAYSIEGDTVPVLAAPEEKRVTFVVAGGVKSVDFPIPFAVGSGDPVIVSGVYHTQGSAIVPIAARTIEARIGDNGPVGALPVPVLARIPGTKTAFSLKLAVLPRSELWERVTEPVTVPARAAFEVSLGIADSGRLAGAVPLKFSVHVRRGQRKESLLIEKVIDPGSAQARGWSAQQASLGAFAGQTVKFVFRAQATGAGRAALFPLFGDPRIMARAERDEKRRNVVLISLDTLGARHLGAYGSRRPTSPAIDELAKSGVILERVFSQWPETAGSHMSLFTARYVSDHGVKSFVSQPSPTVGTLAKDLRSAGYLTKAFTEDGGVWAEAGFARGFHSYVEAKSFDFVYRGEAARTFGAASEWVQRNAKRLFFLFIHTYQVHAPYRPPLGFRQAFGQPQRPGPIALDELNYDREVAFTDRQVGSFIAALEKAGVASTTIVVLTSDHGEEFGEHKGRGHGRTLYSEVTHVPLIFWAPGFLAPARVPEPAALVDIRPTLLDLLGLPAPAEPIAGRSLAAEVRGRAGGGRARPIVSELDREGLRLLAVRNGRATLITDLATGQWRCYEAVDTRELKPLTGGCEGLRKIAARHRPALERTAGKGIALDLDPETKAKLEALGYVQ